MNCVQLSGTIETPPTIINDGDAIRFLLKVTFPALNKRKKSASTYIPCTVFDATAEQQHRLLGKNYAKDRIELTGRLARTVFRDESTHEFFNVEVFVHPNGLLMQRLS